MTYEEAVERVQERNLGERVRAMLFIAAGGTVEVKQDVEGMTWEDRSLDAEAAMLVAMAGVRQWRNLTPKERRALFEVV